MKSRANSLSVCLLSWNGRNHLETCLEALAVQEEPCGSWEVLVLDNGSTDDTVEWLERTWRNKKLGRRGGGELHWHAQPRNLGFCGGNNYLAQRANGENLVFLNNDTRPEPDWLAALSECFSSAEEDVAAIGGRIVDWEAQRVDFVEGLMTFDGHAFQRGYGRPLGSVEEPSPGSEQLFACGGNMIVGRDAFLRAGLFDEGYFAYLEDVDLGWRLWSGGERILYCPEATVRHRSMATSDALGTFNRGLLFERNALRTAYKNYDGDHWQRLAPAILVTFCNRALTMLAESNAGGESILRDPYAPVSTPQSRKDGPGENAVADPTLFEKWRGWGTRDLTRRGLRRLFESLARTLRRPGDPGTFDAGALANEGARPCVELSDPRTVAQLRAFAHFTQNLDAVAEERARLAARRRRPDSEIFARFPLHLVATYPGDEELFDSPGFRGLLPEEPRVRFLTLDQVMETSSSQ